MRSAEVAATTAAANVTTAAQWAADIRHSLAGGVQSLWRHKAGWRVSAEGAAGLDLAAAVVAGVTTALAEMRGLAARRLDWTRWSLLAADRRVRRLQQEENCIRRVLRLWSDYEQEHFWDVLAAAAAAADINVDGDDNAGAEQGHGGTDPGHDHDSGGGTGMDGSRGRSGQDDGDWSAGGLVGGANEDGDTGDSGVGRGACGEWSGEGGGWRASAGPVKGKVRGGTYEDGVRGGRRRQGARRKRMKGWRRWLRGRDATWGYLGTSPRGSVIVSLLPPLAEVPRTGMGDPSRLHVSKTRLCCVGQLEVAILSQIMRDTN